MFLKQPISAHSWNHFPLVPPLKNFKKWPILVSLLILLELGFAGSFGGAVCVKKFSDYCTLSAWQLKDRQICAGVFFKPPKSAHFLKHFPLVPPFEEFQKMADFGVLAKFARTRLCGQLWRCGLRQIVLR